MVDSVMIVSRVSRRRRGDWRLVAGVEERAEWAVPDYSVQPRQLLTNPHPPSVPSQNNLCDMSRVTVRDGP